LVGFATEKNENIKNPPQVCLPNRQKTGLIAEKSTPDTIFSSR
jgi:hypothetical protein